MTSSHSVQSSGKMEPKLSESLTSCACARACAYAHRPSRGGERQEEAGWPACWLAQNAQTCAVATHAPALRRDATPLDETLRATGLEMVSMVRGVNKLSCTTHGSLQPCVVQLRLLAPRLALRKPDTGICERLPLCRTAQPGVPEGARPKP